MNKKIFTFIAFAAALIGCSKENNVSVTPLKGAQTLVISATIGTPDTKLSYTPNENGGYTATFNGSERLQMYFLNAKDSTLQRSLVPVDPYSISDDGKTANFVVTNLVVPAAATKIFSYIDFNNAPVTYTDTLNVNDLSLQANLAAAQSHHILVGSVNVADLTSKEPGKVAVAIKYSYKTSLIRFNLTLPVRPTADANTVITISNKNNTIHNKVNFAQGELTAASSSVGDIVIYPSEVDTNTNVATAMACVWAGDNFKDTRVTAVMGEDSYYVDLNLSKETLEAGKVYDVTRTLVVAPKPVEVWKTDEAGTADFKAGGTETLTTDWLSYTGGKVSWTANTTGIPRTAVLNFANGSSYKVTQISSTDFKGNWNFTAEFFCKDGFTSSGDKQTLSNIVFGAPLKGEKLSDGTGIEHTNNIGIGGLYHAGIIADASVEVDYAAKTVKFGLFTDARTAQLDATPVSAAYPYIAILPETTSTYTDAAKWGGAGTWTFVAPDLGTPDYEWIWFDVSSDFNTLTYSAAMAQTLTASNPNKYGTFIIGITVQAFSSADVTLANSQSAAVDSYTNMIYQFNTNNGNIGMVFQRK
jgi:hypothetical protein